MKNLKSLCLLFLLVILGCQDKSNVEKQIIIKKENLKSTTATELFRNSLDKFLAKDVKGWSAFLLMMW